MRPLPFLFALLTLLTSPSLVAAREPAVCAIPELQRLAPVGVTILAAKSVAASGKLPTHCLVDANVATPGNVVDFRLALPASWNKKLLFNGVGGFAGSLAKLDNGLERGYATATTDTGHKASSGTDGSWALDHRPRELDYGHRGTHVSVVAAKQLTRAYYGGKLERAYFNGCSNGGRQALMEAQRYPADFDGIIAGAPSFGAMGYVRRALTYQPLLAAPDRALPPAKIDLLSRAVVAACDGTDGLVDGLVSDPRLCSFDPQPLRCTRGDAPGCLTPGQLEAIAVLRADTVLPNGQHLRGMPLGHEAGDSGWPQWITGKKPPVPGPDGRLQFLEEPPTAYRFADGFFRYLAFDRDDPSYDFRTFDVETEFSKLAAIIPILSPTDPNLARFAARGGKLLLYHGWADPGLSAYATIDYFDKVVASAGGKARADAFVRLFLAPGMHHCAGGPGPDSFDRLSALEQWVEKGVAPTKLIATHSTQGVVDRTRPLCPEPQRARYIGTGSIDAAESFTCN